MCECFFSSVYFSFCFVLLFFLLLFAFPLVFTFFFSFKSCVFFFSQTLDEFIFVSFISKNTVCVITYFQCKCTWSICSSVNNKKKLFCFLSFPCFAFNLTKKEIVISNDCIDKWNCNGSRDDIFEVPTLHFILVSLQFSVFCFHSQSAIKHSFRYILDTDIDFIWKQWPKIYEHSIFLSSCITLLSFHF